MTCVNRLLYLNKKFYLMLMTCDSIKVESVLNNCYRTDVMGWVCIFGLHFESEKLYKSVQDSFVHSTIYH